MFNGKKKPKQTNMNKRQPPRKKSPSNFVYSHSTISSTTISSTEMSIPFHAIGSNLKMIEIKIKR
jgi:hypothetical protein